MVEFPTQFFDTFPGVIKCINFYLAIMHDIHRHTIYSGNSARDVLLITKIT